MNEHAYSVSEVLAGRAALNGKTICVRGVLTIGREDHSIADTHRPDLRSSRLWVYFHHATLGTRENQLSKLDGVRVIATGVLDLSRKGHFDSCAGSFTIRDMEMDETLIG